MNEEWGEEIVRALVRHGVQRFCLASGSRSTPLVLAIAKNSSVQPFVHFDERGMAFYALGLAKASGEPVAIVVTSGTAVGNLMPAVMEASLARVPLIVITTDRPPELRDTGANQALDQVKIFTNFVRWQVDIPCSDLSIPGHYLETTIAQAVYAAKRSPKGPVHLNCMFREPFFSEKPSKKQIYHTRLDLPLFDRARHSPIDANFVRLPNDEHHSQIGKGEEEDRLGKVAAGQKAANLTACGIAIFSTHYIQPERMLVSIEPLAKLIESKKTGVILVGEQSPKASFASIIQAGKRLGWPIFTDILSGLRSRGEPNSFVQHCDLLCKLENDLLQFDCILHLGGRIVSKVIAEKLSATTYIHVDDHPFREDPKHQITHRVEMDPLHFCEKLVEALPTLERAPSPWIEKGKEIGFAIEVFFKEKNALSEAAIIFLLSQLTPENYSLFFANSMPIRHANQLFFPKKPIGPLFGNRGVSGIDGNIATSIGIAAALQKPLIAVLGDLAFLHDMNSLAQLRKCSVSIVFLVLNNGGGGIFSFLPIAKKEEELLDTYFACAHDFSLEKIASFFDLDYFSPQTLNEAENTLNTVFANPRAMLMEIKTARNDNVDLYDKLLVELRNRKRLEIGCL